VETAVRTPPLDTLPGLIVSQPVSGPAAASGSVRGLSASALVGGSVVYVSLVPGTVPEGLQATIRNQENGQIVTTAVVDGGFDPVAIAASVGDTLAVQITCSGAAEDLRAMEPVRATHPPVVVRTSPPSGGRDVPLNAIMVLVFSEPLDSATVDSGSVEVWRGTAPVAGTVRFADAAHLRAEFHPDSFLLPQTDYQLVVTTAIRDVSGLALDSAVTVPFTTGTTATLTATLRITVGTSGSQPDTDGYAGCVDPASAGHGATACGYGGPVALAMNGSARVTVDTGAHAVLLTGVAANCSVTGDNPRAVLRAAPGDTVVVPFSINCVPVTLHITTTTTGVSLDPDGYSVCVDLVPDPWYPDYDCTIAEAIGVNGSVTVSVAPGSHDVSLDGVAGNCTVSGGGTLTAVGSTEVPLAITCVAAGSVRVTTVTSGTDLPAGAYSACLDSSGGCLAMGTNAVATYNGVIPGPHTVTLTGVAGNCTVSGGMTRGFTVAQDATADVAFEVACTPVGQIAFSSGGAIAVIRSDGQALQSITAGNAPAWSPDGTRLAYECGEDICMVNADGSGFAQLTGNPAGNHHPTWAPDGLKIAFAATHAGVVDLYVMGADGSGIVRLTQGVGFVGSPAWSPDGTKIAFDCQVDAGNDDLCSVNADGTGFARLTSDLARDGGAAWKPDGSALAFTTTRYGPDEIVLMSPAGGSVTRIGTGLPGFAPTWSADGTRLAFVRADGYPSDHVLVARADGSDVRDLTAGDQPAWKPHP
jgi:hypothetical protein